jgi:CubicO group peptidase (beta-lactamase class C family)
MNPGSGTEVAYGAIDSYLEQQIRRLRIPGLALAIVEGDRITYTRGFGRARPNGETPSPQTPFVLGSTTKSFTALAVMQLVEDGKVDLDAPVRRYLPWFRVADPFASALITVRQLLNQTSGLPGIPGMDLLADMDAAPGAAERQARGLADLKLSRDPGAGFEYSNLNYNLLGLIVEAAAGQPYSDFIQQRIFAPLQMRHSYTSPAAARQDGLAVGHRYWFGYPVPAPNLPMPAGSLASGQLISTSEDLAHYLIAHLNGGCYGTVRILSDSGIAELHAAAAEQLVMGKLVAKYAMGWWDEEVGGARIISHSGIVPDFSSYMAVLPEHNKGFVLLVNAGHYGLPLVLTEVGTGVAALLAGRQPPPIRLGFLPWAMRALALIPLLQLVGVVATFAALARSRRNPALRPAGGLQRGLRIVLPLFGNLALVAVPLLVRRARLDRYMAIFNPDISWVARLCGGFAAVWAVARTILLGREQAGR